jgi:hypothetical protein
MTSYPMLLQNVMKLGHNQRAMLDMPEDQKPPVT